MNILKNYKIISISSLFILFFIWLLILNIDISFSTTDSNVIKQEGNLNTLITRHDSKFSIKLSFIGDSLIGSYLGNNYKGNFRYLLENNEYSYPYKYVSHIFKNDDYTIANGENVFTDKNLLPIEKNYRPAYWYYAPTRFANVYKESSIEVVSVMNNHSYDYGSLGYSDTKEAILNAGLILGAEDPVILSKNNFKIALLCINLFHRSQYEHCIKDIKRIRNDVNYIIVYFHGGVEYLYYPSDEIIEYAHGFIDNGADLVLGAHPHVLQPRESYNNKKIIYSLGSFLFSNAGLTNRTIIYQMNLEINKENYSYSEYDNIIPCYLYTGSSGDDYLIPSPISNAFEKQKVLDFMNGLIDKPI